ncbi:MAG: HAD-IA family hydrolase [Sphingomonadaceae bacterium]
MTLKALIFGSVGTLTETSELQRQAFNAAFAEAGLDWHWDAERYAAMVSGDDAVVGGIERIAQFARIQGAPVDLADAERMHAAKSRHYQETMQSQGLAVNPGVTALLDEAKAASIKTVFASTTSRANIDALLAATRPPLGDRFDLIMSGADVARAKPAPDVYRALLDRLAIAPAEAIAIEDSLPSLQAARDAGIPAILVPGAIWRGRDMGGAPVVIEYLAGQTLASLVEKFA